MDRLERLSTREPPQRDAASIPFLADRTFAQLFDYRIPSPYSTTALCRLGCFTACKCSWLTEQILRQEFEGCDERTKGTDRELLEKSHVAVDVVRWSGGSDGVLISLIVGLPR